MILEIENLSKSYLKNLKRVHALRNVTFFVEPGQVVGVLGPNGAGKTTLLKIVAGIARPDSGKISVFGSRDIDSVRRRIGFLPENPEFLKNVTAGELLHFTMRLSGLGPASGVIDDALCQVRLLEEKHRRVRGFSKGMRQRIGIAQAIIHQPDLLILDEPMSGLDPSGRRMLAEIIRDFHARGKTVLLSSHNLEDIEILCSRVILINQGEIRIDERLEKLREDGVYWVETWENGERKRCRVTSDSELWTILEDIRRRRLRLIRVQSGVPQHLERYYE